MHHGLELLFDLGQRDLRLRAADIRALCRSAADGVQLDHPERWIALQSPRAGDGAGRWDTDQVFHLLSSLLEHAVVRGVPDAPVWVEWHGTDDAVLVEIEYEPRFLPTAEASRDAPEDELGLGPLVAAAVARAHGGAVRFARTPLGGVRWTVHLPREPDRRPHASGARALEAHP